MNNYKSSASRLARLFKRSRDNWKSRAKAKQEKIKALETKVRDLKRSREYWKEKAKECVPCLAEQETVKQETVQSKKAEIQAEKGIEEREASAKKGGGWQQVKGHHYPAEIVQLGIEQVTHSLNSLRGSEKTFRLFSQYFKVSVPSYNSIRSWLLRVGLYELKQRPVYGEDWVLMLDATLELGTLKCLGILGIPVSRLSETGYSLKHKDVDVLALVPLSSCTGEVICQQLKDVTQQQKRSPLQIVSDHGSDIKKGIGLYKQDYPKLIWIHDVTHAMALLLKKELKTDETYQTFMRQCALTRQQIKQTPLYFLAPPKQRAKSRYLNIESHIRWAQQLLHYQDQADFSDINPNFQLDKTALALLQTQLDPDTFTKLSQLDGKIYPDRHSFCQHLRQELGEKRWAEYERPLCLATDLGRRSFEKKLAWVADYRSDLLSYAQLSRMVNLIAQQLKQYGLSRSSICHFVKQTASLTLSPRLLQFRNRILAYLRSHIQSLSSQQTVLASSDVIESIFGKYKLFSSERSFKEIGQMILTIPLFTAQLNPSRIKLALENVSMADVLAWAKQTFGSSMLAKRRNLLSFSTTHFRQDKFSWFYPQN